MNASYRIERVESNCKVSVNGGLTATLVPELKDALRREMQQETRELVFDLLETNMVDSTGIGLLIATSNTIGRTSGFVRVINPAKEIYDLLSHMRLVSRLNITPKTR